MKKPTATFNVVENTQICVLKNVVASYPHLNKPNSFDGTPDKEKYSIGGLLEIGETAYVEMKKFLASTMPKEYKPDVSKLPFKEPKKTHDAWQEIHGVSAWLVKCVNRKKPKTFDAQGNEIDAADIPAGAIVNICFEPFWFTNKFGDYLQLQLKSVMLVSPYLTFQSDDENIGADAFGVTPPRDADAFSTPRGTKPSNQTKSPSNPDVDFDDDIPF